MSIFLHHCVAEPSSKGNMSALCKHHLHFCSLELRPDCMFWLQSKKEIAKGLRVMTKEENFPVLVHCMHGKDRTGLLIMLLLLLCDIEPQVPTPS